MADPLFQTAQLPAGLLEPGIYVTLRADSDPGLTAVNNRCLLAGYMVSGNFAPNMPIRVLSQDQVDAGAGSYSMLAHMYAAAKAQVPIGSEVWCLPLIPPSGGTAQIVHFEITGEPTAGVLSSATTAAAADTMRVRYRGRGCDVGISAGDTFAQIAANFKTAWDLIDNAPASCGVSTATCSLTSRQKGLYDEGALEVSFLSKGASGVAAVVGTLTVTGTAAVAATGSLLVTMGKHTASVAVTDTETNTALGTAVVNKLLSDSYPIRPGQPASPTGAVSLFFVNGRPIRPLSVSAALTGVTTQTVAVSVGTAGAGVPTLTSALANMAAQDDYQKAWALFFNSATELGTVATHIEAQAAPAILKQSVVIFTSTESLATVAANDIVNATSPKLNTSARYMAAWAQCDGNAAFETSARIASAVAAESYVGRNWNSLEMIGTADAPVVGIHPGDRPRPDERNSAISLHLAPLTVDAGGSMVVKWGGSTYRAKGFKDAKLTKLSTRLTLDYYNSDLVVTLAPYIKLKIKAVGEPRTANATSPQRLQAEIYRWMKKLDDVDLFDGADQKAAAVKVAPSTKAGEWDINVPMAPLADLDILAPVGILQ